MHTEMTVEEAMNVQSELLEKYHLETYYDAHMMCHKLIEFVESDEVLSKEDNTDNDAVTKINRKNIRNLLYVLSTMFLDCDEYYRRY